MSAFVKFVAFAGLSVMANAQPGSTFGTGAKCLAAGGACVDNCGNGCEDACSLQGIPFLSPNQCNALGNPNSDQQDCPENPQSASGKAYVCCGCDGSSSGDTCADFDGSVCAGDLKLPDDTPGNTALECCVCPPCEIGCDPTFECVAAARKLLELEVSKPNLRA